MRNLAALAVSVFAGLCGTANANLVTNGSFEQGAFVNTSCNYMELTPGNGALTGWDVSATVAWGMNTCDGNVASEGNAFVDLSSFGAQSIGSLSQDLALVDGMEYQLSIDTMGGDVSISIGNVLLDLVGSSGGWVTTLFTFVADGSLLTITNSAPGNPIVFIDNLIVTGASPVPLPAAFPLMAMGAGALGWAARRRRRKVA